ncbi:hypothetical protein FQR65_LT04348 [Abscondita terminalis]|nr:hypothetical protein FQR65_LT04348 [Abscondita terminalis]
MHEGAKEAVGKIGTEKRRHQIWVKDQLEEAVQDKKQTNHKWVMYSILIPDPNRLYKVELANIAKTIIDELVEEDEVGVVQEMKEDEERQEFESVEVEIIEYAHKC